MRNDMWSKGLVFWIIVVLMGASIIPSLINSNVKGDNRFSGDEGVIDRINTNRQENQVISENSFDEKAIYFYSHVDSMAMGRSSGGIVEIAIRITPTELAGYTGWRLTAARYYHHVVTGTNPTHYCTLKIYHSGTAISPGSLLESVPFNATGEGWVRIDLPAPLQLDINQDIWISISIPHLQGEGPCAGDGDLAVDGKGDWWWSFLYGWYEMQYQSRAIPGTNSYQTNWNIEGIISVNNPPNLPIITGPTEGTIGFATDYNFTAIDPNDDEVYYFIDWGDNTNSSWIGLYSSGEQITKSHTWSIKGNYTIKAKAKDTFGNESGWATLTVKMPCSYKTIQQFLELLFQRFPHAFPILRQLLEY